MKNSTTHQALELLTAAGLDYEVVDRCPRPDCDVCLTQPALPEAA